MPGSRNDDHVIAHTGGQHLTGNNTKRKHNHSVTVWVRTAEATGMAHPQYLAEKKSTYQHGDGRHRQP